MTSAVPYAKKSHPEGELCGIVKDIGDICNGILEAEGDCEGDNTDASTGLMIGLGKSFRLSKTMKI